MPDRCGASSKHEELGDPIHLPFTIGEIQDADDPTTLRLGELPSGLNDYFRQWWDGLSKCAGTDISTEPVKVMLGCLLVARGGLSRSDSIDVRPDDQLGELSCTRGVRTR